MAVSYPAPTPKGLDHGWDFSFYEAKQEFEVDGVVHVFSTFYVELDDPFGVGNLDIMEGYKVLGRRLILNSQMNDECPASLRLLPADKVKFPEENNQPNYTRPEDLAEPDRANEVDLHMRGYFVKEYESSSIYEHLVDLHQQSF